MKSSDPRAQEKMLSSRNKRVALRYEGPLKQAVSGFVHAFQNAVEEIGKEHYVERWGHSFPQEAWDALIGSE